MREREGAEGKEAAKRGPPTTTKGRRSKHEGCRLAEIEIGNVLLTARRRLPDGHLLVPGQNVFWMVQ